MRKPIIGIVGNVMRMETGPIPGLDRSYVNEDYVNAVVKAGGIPIVLPIVDDLNLVHQQIESCDCIIISGGQDIHPKFYSENQHRELGFVNSRIDLYQIELARLAIEKDMPLLGICRGMQVVNVVSGGSLYQDLSELSGEVLKHVQSGRRYEVAHKIQLESDSILNGIFGESVMVNSYHHQSLKAVGDGLRVTARAEDGIIEAVEMIDKKFVVGVQWHPEMMLAGDEGMLGLFKALVENFKKAGEY